NSFSVRWQHEHVHGCVEFPNIAPQAQEQEPPCLLQLLDLLRLYRVILVRLDGAYHQEANIGVPLYQQPSGGEELPQSLLIGQSGRDSYDELIIANAQTLPDRLPRGVGGGWVEPRQVDAVADIEQAVPRPKPQPSRGLH